MTRGTQSRSGLARALGGPTLVAIGALALSLSLPAAAAASAAGEQYVLTLPGVPVAQPDAPTPELGDGRAPGIGGVSGERGAPESGLAALGAGATTPPALALGGLLALAILRSPIIALSSARRRRADGSRE